MPTIVVAGSINQDIVVRAPRIPVPGESIIGGDLSLVRGGKGANQAVAAARLGATTRFLGRVGDDAFGRELLAGLRGNGVESSGVVVDPGPSGVAIITIDEAGENAIVVAPGANARCVPEDILAEAMADADAVLCQLETSIPFVLAAFAAGRQAGAATVLDAAPASPLGADVLRWVDLLTLNETEARIVLGLSPDANIAVDALAEQLLALGPHTLVLKLGAQGGMAIRGAERVALPAPFVRVVDTTGAGDAFTGALAVALAEGAGLADALRFAVHAGSLACAVLGAQPSMPTRDAVERSLRAG